MYLGHGICSSGKQILFISHIRFYLREVLSSQIEEPQKKSGARASIVAKILKRRKKKKCATSALGQPVVKSFVVRVFSRLVSVLRYSWSLTTIHKAISRVWSRYCAFKPKVQFFFCARGYGGIMHRIAHSRTLPRALPTPIFSRRRNSYPSKF